MPVPWGPLPRPRGGVPHGREGCNGRCPIPGNPRAWTVASIRRLHRNRLLRAHTCRFGTGFRASDIGGDSTLAGGGPPSPENLRIGSPADPRAPNSARAHHRCVPSGGAGTGSRPLPPSRRFVVFMVAANMIRTARNALAFSNPDPGHPVRTSPTNPAPQDAESTARAAQHKGSRHHG